jgi:hypothetical protein
MPARTPQYALALDEPSRVVRYHQLKPIGVPYSRQHLAVLESRGEFPRRLL